MAFIEASFLSGSLQSKNRPFFGYRRYRHTFIKFQRISLIIIGLNAIYITVINTTINRIAIQFLSNQIAGTVKISGVKLLNHFFRGLK